MICGFYALITQFKKDLTVFCMIWSAFADKENVSTFPSIPWSIYGYGNGYINCKSMKMSNKGIAFPKFPLFPRKKGEVGKDFRKFGDKKMDCFELRWLFVVDCVKIA
jgi:hypothetical protein